MSKSKLTKELLLMDKEQLIQVILDSYSARKEIKDYFDYFVDPQPDRMLEKAQTAIYKELNRSSRGYSKARITKIRSVINDFKSLQPGAEHVSRLYMFTFIFMGETSRSVRLKDTLLNGLVKLVSDYLKFAESFLFMSTALEELERFISSGGFSRNFRNTIKSAIENIISEMQSSLS